MKAVILNGAINDDLEPFSKQISLSLGKAGWEIREFNLQDLDIAPCRGCFNCWLKTPGICVINDDGRETTRAIAQSDLLVFLTPLTFGGYSHQLKKALDRFIPNILPLFIKIKGETHHPMRYTRRQSLLALGVSEGEPEPVSSRVFRELVKRNALNLNCLRLGVEVLSSGWSPEERERVIRDIMQKAGMEHA